MAKHPVYQHRLRDQKRSLFKMPSMANIFCDVETCIKNNNGKLIILRSRIILLLEFFPLSNRSVKAASPNITPIPTGMLKGAQRSLLNARCFGFFYDAQSPLAPPLFSKTCCCKIFFNLMQVGNKKRTIIATGFLGRCACFRP